MVKRWTPGEVNYVSQNMKETKNERKNCAWTEKKNETVKRKVLYWRNLMLHTHKNKTIHTASLCLWMKWGANAFCSIHDSNEMNLEWEYNAFNKKRVHKKIITSKTYNSAIFTFCIFLSLSYKWLAVFHSPNPPSLLPDSSQLLFIWLRLVLKMTSDHIDGKYEQRMNEILKYQAVVQTKASELNSILKHFFQRIKDLHSALEYKASTCSTGLQNNSKPKGNNNKKISRWTTR